MIVKIPPQEYSLVVYRDVYNCYLATELKKLGYEDVICGPSRVYQGEEMTPIFNITSCLFTQDPKEAITQAFNNKQEIELELIPL